jgi:hypothetical protein
LHWSAAVFASHLASARRMSRIFLISVSIASNRSHFRSCVVRFAPRSSFAPSERCSSRETRGTSYKRYDTQGNVYMLGDFISLSLSLIVSGIGCLDVKLVLFEASVGPQVVIIRSLTSHDRS